MSATNKFDWLLRQTGTLAEMSLLQVCVIACHHKETTVDGRAFQPHCVWLSPAEVARRCGLNERTVPAVFARLIQRGLIESAGRFGRTGQIRVYRLLIDDTESPKEPAPFEKAESPKEPALFEVESPKEPAPLDEGEARRFLHRSPKVSTSKPEGSCISLIEGKREFRREVKREKTRVSKSRDLVSEFPQYLTGVDPQVLADWQILRKQKRAPITTTVLDDIANEAGKVDMTMAEALVKMCARGWQGFEAEWIRRERDATSAGARRKTSHSGFDKLDYSKDINPDGSFK